jgi:predicted RNase H-like HicB family nuclease
MGLTAEVLLLEPRELNGLAFFAETPEEAAQKAREYLGTPTERN